MNLALLIERYGPLLQMDGYDECIAGVCLINGRDPVLIYDHAKVIAKLMADGMSREDAEEFHDFNQAGTYLGDKTPAFLVTE